MKCLKLKENHIPTLSLEEILSRKHLKRYAETRLYYYGARYYNPRESQWLSVDPLAEKYPNFSPYAYTFQNPINFIDPTGMEGEPPVYRERSILSGGKSVIKFYPTSYDVDRIIDYGGDDPGFMAKGAYGYILANDMETKLEVFKPTHIYDTYDKKYRQVSVEQGLTNCYGDVLVNGEYIVMGGPNEIVDFLLADGYRSIPIGSDTQVGDIMMDNNGGHIMQVIGKYELGKNKGKMMWRSYWAGDHPVVGTLGEVTDYNHKNNNGHSRSEHNSSNTKLFRPTQGDKVKQQFGGMKEEQRVVTSSGYNYEIL